MLIPSKVQDLFSEVFVGDSVAQLGTSFYISSDAFQVHPVDAPPHESNVFFILADRPSIFTKRFVSGCKQGRQQCQQPLALALSNPSIGSSHVLCQDELDGHCGMDELYI